MYTKLLKELNKGNAVLLEIISRNPSCYLPRYRIVTSNSCEYSMIYSQEAFNISCFMHSRFNMNAESIVEEMQRFDLNHNYKIKKLSII
jgi:hypothetical protein